MNTADRSIAILDTALRRRFTFVELEPNSEVIRISDSGKVEDQIDLALLLTKLNERIVKYYDRDHRIGHSYFLDIDSLKQFQNTWQYKIIPLLMDYFYEDMNTISKIIGERFIDAQSGLQKTLSPEEFISAIQKIYQ